MSLGFLDWNGRRFREYDITCQVEFRIWPASCFEFDKPGQKHHFHVTVITDQSTRCRNREYYNMNLLHHDNFKCLPVEGKLRQLTECIKIEFVVNCFKKSEWKLWLMEGFLVPECDKISNVFIFIVVILNDTNGLSWVLNYGLPLVSCNYKMGSFGGPSSMSAKGSILKDSKGRYFPHLCLPVFCVCVCVCLRWCDLKPAKNRLSFGLILAQRRKFRNVKICFGLVKKNKASSSAVLKNIQFKRAVWKVTHWPIS